MQIVLIVLAGIADNTAALPESCAGGISLTSRQNDLYGSTLLRVRLFARMIVHCVSGRQSCPTGAGCGGWGNPSLEKSAPPGARKSARTQAVEYLRAEDQPRQFAEFVYFRVFGVLLSAF